MFEIKRYTSNLSAEWDNFVLNSKNGTFLLMRPYMDYHSDRFEDYSLLFYRNDRLYALLPANIKDLTLYSHQGLTYGGLIMSPSCSAEGVLHLFEEMNAYLRYRGVRRVVYKAIPHIYSTMPAEEDLYALFRCGARLIARGISTTTDYHCLLRWNKDRHTALNRSRRNALTVRKTHDISCFWPILTANLQQRHNVMPVHTAEEMEMLIGRWPDHIDLYEALSSEGETLGGMLAYNTGRVLHSQYLAASAEGKKCGAIEAVMEQVLQEEGFDYFDFGISTEEGGNILNEGLIYQKEGFGGRGICYDTYEYHI